MKPGPKTTTTKLEQWGQTGEGRLQSLLICLIWGGKETLKSGDADTGESNTCFLPLLWIHFRFTYLIISCHCHTHNITSTQFEGISLFCFRLRCFHFSKTTKRNNNDKQRVKEEYWKLLKTATECRNKPLSDQQGRDHLEKTTPPSPFFILILPLFLCSLSSFFLSVLSF